MTLHGCNIVSAGTPGSEVFQAINPASDERLQPAFAVASYEQIDAAVTGAAATFDSYSRLPGARRADFLNQVAVNLEATAEPIIERAMLETALPRPRLESELARTTGQLRMFAEIAREGSWVDARIDHTQPHRTPPRPDLRRMLIPIGPVAVFGASNFPLAFSVAGGDTASALAAGCPVIVKAHPAHPGVSEICGEAIRSAAHQSQIAAYVFSMLHGGPAVGQTIAMHAELEAIAFTGSLAAGRALFNLAASRPRPIPVFAEMGSVNPMFVLPGKLAAEPESIAQRVAASITLGVGQFCTCPGLVFAIRGDGFEAFIETLAKLLSETPAAPMLTPGICRNLRDRVRAVANAAGVRLLTPLAGEPSGASVSPTLLEVQPDAFVANPMFREEIFGPTALLVPCESYEQALQCMRALDGQLTAALQATEGDLANAHELLRGLERRAGRLIVNGAPTGVEVTGAMHHGGPFPATTDSRFTSVGPSAIRRFARPVCFQNFPDCQLPDPLRDANPLGVARVVDGRSEQPT